MNIIWQVAGIIDSFFVHGCPYQQDRPKDADAADVSVGLHGVVAGRM